MDETLSRRLVPDSLWAPAAPLVPRFTPRPQGGGTGPLDDRVVFTAVVFVLTSGCAWRGLPSCFGVSPATAHRRFTAWTEAGLWEELRRKWAGHRALAGDREWAAAVVAAAHSRARAYRRG
ncbi:transposase [Saccharothrix sp. SC076]|nr:transposase [Saccharothrix obliqua]